MGNLLHNFFFFFLLVSNFYCRTGDIVVLVSERKNNYFAVFEWGI